MSRPPNYRFQLYVAGDAPNSLAAIDNFNAQSKRCFLPGKFSIEIIDVFRDPKRALREGIFLTPTLVRTAPAPAQRVVGSLSQAQPVRRLMGWIDSGAV